MTQRSMMSRTTTAFGAFALSVMLAYVGYLIANDVEKGAAFRVVAATALTLAAFACISKGLRELRGETRTKQLRAGSLHR